MNQEDMPLHPVKEIITNEDRLRTEAKFNVWDKFIKGELKENVELSLLKDPTIWAYAQLKDKKGNQLKLRAWQDLIINDRCRYIVCAASNQVGKTASACVKIIHHLQFVPNATVLITSRNFDLAKKVLMDIREFCMRSNIQLSDDIDNKCMLTINNYDGKGVSKAVAVPATESALSWDATLIVWDEAFFTDNGIYLFDQVFETRTNATKNWKHPFLTLGQIMIISNPNGKHGLGWKLWNDSRFSRFRFDFLANPDNTPEEFKFYARTLPSDVFDSCYAAVFSSASGRFIPAAWYDKACEDYDLILPHKHLVYLGMDLAGEDVKSRSLDFNELFGAIVLKNEMKEPVVKVVYHKEWKSGTSRKIMYEELMRLMKSCNFGGIAYDKPGVGDNVHSTLTDPNGKYRVPGYLVHPLTYSLPNKSDVYHNLHTLYEFSRIIHPDIPKLRSQFETLDFERTEAGHLTNKVMYKIHHAKESQKDDLTDALANCCFEAIRLSKSRASMTYI